MFGLGVQWQLTGEIKGSFGYPYLKTLTMATGDIKGLEEVSGPLFTEVNLKDKLMAIVTPGTSGNVLTSNGSAWVSSPASGGVSEDEVIGLILAFS